MEPTSRLYQCARCHQQTTICRRCDHGNIYCGTVCAIQARINSLCLAGVRYQATLNGKRHHAARQARYRLRHAKKVTHQGSPATRPYAPIQLLENKPETPVKIQQGAVLVCCFCKKPISAWLRNDFLRRRDPKKSTGLQACPQAP